jgi:N-acetylglucosaminyldiphosphoundecaprenol N-acetyl-beta-D-mannosaminyltransferase
MEHFDVFGMKVSNFTMKEIESLFDQTINSNSNIVMYGYSFGLISAFKKYSDLYSIVNSFDINVCDGTIFNWFCLLNGFKLITILSVPELTNYTLEYADRNNLKILLFGAKKEVNFRAIKILSKKYPNINFLEGIDGYFKEIDESSIIDRINELSPDILLIGITAPIKERIAYKYKNVLSSKIIIPCGGMIDVYAGLTKQTPRLIKKLGLATPFRIIQEPKRLFILNISIVYDILIKILPLTFYYRVILKKKDFNLIKEYLR